MVARKGSLCIIGAEFAQAVGGGGIKIPLEILDHLAASILDVDAHGALTVEGRALQGLVDEFHAPLNITASTAQVSGEVGEVSHGGAVEKLEEAGAEIRQAVGAVTACGVIGSMLSKPDSRHYCSLKLPNWQPPAIAFPIVWTALYADIAVINSIVLADHIEEDTAKSKAAARKHAAVLGANLAWNAGWSGVFFRAKRKRLAAVWAGVLAASSGDLVRRAWKFAPERGALLAPYAAWTGFATVLSAEIARLNRKR